MLDMARLFAGAQAGAGGGEWNTIVKPTGSPMSYGTDGSVAGLNMDAGAFGSGLQDIGKAYGQQSQARPQGAFGAPNTPTMPQAVSPENAMNAAAMARSRQQASISPFAGGQPLRRPFDAGV